MTIKTYEKVSNVTSNKRAKNQNHSGIPFPRHRCTRWVHLETKKHGPNERTGETPKKELNKIEISNLLDVEFKTMVIRMLKGLSEDLNSTKKDPVRNGGNTN